MQDKFHGTRDRRRPSNRHKHPITAHVDTGPVHKGTNHVPKAISDRDPLPDWVRDLTYVRSQALQTPSQSRTGSVHCEVICCSYCAVRANWPMHGFSTHFQNAHAPITFRRALHSHVLRIRLSTWITIQNAPFFAFQRPVSKAWIESALRSQRIKSRFQITKGSKSRSWSETAFGTRFVPLWTGP